MNSIDQAIMNMLNVNMGYKEGETVAVVMQEWDNKLGKEVRPAFERSEALCKRIVEIYDKAGIGVELLSYVPSEARSGVDASPELYQNIGTKDIIFMPTAYSLTHTAFRKEQTQKGSRIASMPTFTLDMFEKGGPMDVDYSLINKQTEEIAEVLRNSKYVKVTGEGTCMWVQIDRDLVHVASGLITQEGEMDNLPGAEAYAVPVHEGNSNGFFTIPKGWGGVFPLEYDAEFIVLNGRIYGIVGETKKAQDYIDKVVKPEVFGGKDFNILAELGIGTNPNVDSDYIKEHGWSPLTAEKIIGSAHFANGNSFGMGGKNDVPVHIDWVVPNAKIRYFC